MEKKNTKGGNKQIVQELEYNEVFTGISGANCKLHLGGQATKEAINDKTIYIVT